MSKQEKLHGERRAIEGGPIMYTTTGDATTGEEWSSLDIFAPKLIPDGEGSVTEEELEVAEKALEETYFAVPGEDYEKAPGEAERESLWGTSAQSSPTNTWADK